MTATTKTAAAKPKAAAKSKIAKPKTPSKSAAPQVAPNAKAETKPAAAAAATKPEVAKKPVPDTRPAKPLAPPVVELIALLKTKKGATNEEAAKAIKGFKSSRDVRAAIRDKVRKLHSVTKEHNGERGGVVFRIKS